MRCSFSQQFDGALNDLDAILAKAFAYRHLPQVVWAFDPEVGACRRVWWADPRERRDLRRTALAVARLEALDRPWELN